MAFVPHPDDPILNPTWLLGSFEWREPVTTLTDFSVAIVSFYALWQFLRFKGEKNRNFKLYKLYFLCYAIGMTSAAWLGHGLQAYISADWKIIGWVMSAIGLMFFLLASLNQLEKNWDKKIITSFKVIVVIKLLIFVCLVLMPQTSSFKLVQIHSTIDLVGLVLPLQFINYKMNKSAGSLFIIGAVLYAIVPGIIYSHQLSIDKWFNYHDISHVLMAIFIYIMYLGAFRLSTDTTV